LRNALIPLITAAGQVFAEVITGSFFIETIFRVPGLGRYFTTSIMERDYPMIMATTLLLGALFGVINLISDVAYGIADPRIRLGEKENSYV
jgi:ABC-type dipeptide/oligopeptide/nickel transport system permease component